ncbi:MAG: DUF5752 family protein [Candidatus Hydrothermarchaeales archaeon]
MVEVVILAGGYGTRLWPLSLTKPKPMITLANKPILDHIMEYLEKHAFKDIVITTNYFRDTIEEYFGDGRRFGVKIRFPLEKYPLGTAGSVKNVEGLMDGTFIVIQGDNVTDIDLRNVYRKHKKRGGLCSIVLKEVDEPWRFGVVELEGERIKNFAEKPEKGSEPSNLINSGIYVMEQEIFERIPEEEPYDFAEDLFPKLIENDEEIYGYCADGFWADVGAPDGYFAANEWILSRLNDFEFSDTTFIGDDVEIQPPVIIGEDGMIEDGVKIGPYSVIGDNSVVHEGSQIIGASIFEGSALGRNSFISSSIIGENVVIKKNAKITDSLVGDSCQFGHDCEVTSNSKVWPNTFLSPFSRVNGVLRRFVQAKENYAAEVLEMGPSYILRTVSDEEAFYFNKSENNEVIFTGRVAKSLDEFSEILKTIEFTSLEHHICRGINDFEAWVKLVLKDPLLMSYYRTIGESDLFEEELRRELVKETDLRCKRLHEHRVKYTVV